MGIAARTPVVAVIGLGYWGPNLVRVLSERNDVDLRWMCDVDPDRLDKLAWRYPAIRRTFELDDILADPEVDGVLIATPVFTHHELARRCLRAGKHTFVEKPLAPSTDEAADLMNMARERERVLMCGHTFLYSPPVRAVRELINSGELGDLFFITASRVNLGIHQSDVSVIWDLGPHDFSILLYWLGVAPSAVRATGRASIVPGIADIAFVNLEFPTGLIANVELSWLAPSKLRRTVIVGSRKMVVYEDGAPEPLRIYDRGVVYKDPESFGEYQLSYRTGDILSPNLSSDEPLALQSSEFLGAMRTSKLGGENLAIAYDVVRLAQAAEASMNDGGSFVGLAEPDGVTPAARSAGARARG